MSNIYSKRFLIRLIAKSVFLFVGLHYTWLCYYSYLSANSQQESVVVLKFDSNHISHENRITRHIPPTNLTRNHTYQPTNSITSDDRRLSVSTVSTPISAFPRCERPVFLVIVVFSAPTNFDRRSIIRSTWAEIIDKDSDITNIITKGSYSRQSLVKTMFLLGQSNKKTNSIIQTESEYYNDLVIGSFTDSYGNLTLKTKLGLEWAHQFCKFQYYLKTDDDIFVYSKGLVKWLWQLPRERVYTGRCAFNKTVIRTTGHKWAVPKTEYEKDIYPPYCVGMGYIFSSDVLQKMILILPTQSWIVLEDVYVGLILEKLKIVPKDNSKYFHIHSNYLWEVCKHKNLLLSLPATSKQMLELHLKFSNLWKCGPVDYFKKI